MRRRRFILGIGALLLTFACVDGTGPRIEELSLGDLGLVASVANDDGRGVDLRIPKFQEGVELETLSVTFLAIRGQDCWATIRYSGPADLGCTYPADNGEKNEEDDEDDEEDDEDDEEDDEDDEEDDEAGSAADPEIYLTLWVPSSALYRRPDGTKFENGDAVEITITLDPERLLVSFEPSGLVFSGSNPARLFLSYARAIRDFDVDGDEDEVDEYLEAYHLKLWTRESEGDAWHPYYGDQSVTEHWFNGWLRHFSDHAISW